MFIEVSASHQRGVTIIELIMFIVIVGVGVAGILSVLNYTAAHSSDPLPTKQALAIAESLLEEVELAPYTWCDPADAYALTATSSVIGPTGCATTPVTIGPVAGKTRPFENVAYYNGYAMTGITDITNAGITELGSYNASINVASTTLNGAPAMLVTVNVTGPSSTSVSLSGYRTRYAPNSVP